jgi:hypothetical protein
MNKMMELGNLKVEACTVKNIGVSSVKNRARSVKNNGLNLKVNHGKNKNSTSIKTRPRVLKVLRPGFRQKQGWLRPVSSLL